jgi:hypothetical protein
MLVSEREFKRIMDCRWVDDKRSSCHSNSREFMNDPGRAGESLDGAQFQPAAASVDDIAVPTGIRHRVD